MSKALESGQPRFPASGITHREAKYIALRLQGMTRKAAALKCGYSPWMAKTPQFIENGEVKAEIERLQGELVQNALNAGLIDAAEIHDYLTEALRADMRDIRNDDGSFKPQSEWPEIWGRMMEAGDCEVEYASERSHDGETKDKEGGWDIKGQVLKVKVKFASRTKLLELAMKHKGVNAMVEQRGGDTNILVVTADTARKVGNARKRLAEARNVTPTICREEASLHKTSSAKDSEDTPTNGDQE